MNKVIEDLINRKTYLKEENRSPNIGEFKYGKSSSIDEILGGVNAYRYDIYKTVKKKGKIINLGGGDPLPFKTYKYVKEDINKYLRDGELSEYPQTSGNKKIKNTIINYLKTLNIEIESNELVFTNSTTHAYTLILIR